MEELTLEQIEGLYEQVQNDEKGTARSILSADLDEEKKSAVMVMLKVAKENSLEDFRLFVQEGEMPPTSLTEKEMESLLGGWGVYEVCATATIALKVASMCMGSGGGGDGRKKKGNSSSTN